jgi:hypothetical protein
VSTTGGRGVSADADQVASVLDLDGPEAARGAVREDEVVAVEEHGVGRIVGGVGVGPSVVFRDPLEIEAPHALHAGAAGGDASDVG